MKEYVIEEFDGMPREFKKYMDKEKGLSVGSPLK